MQKTVHPAIVTSQVDHTHHKPNFCLFPITPKLNSNGIPKKIRLSGFDFHHLSAAPSLGNHLTTSTAGRIVGVHPQDWIATSPTGLRTSCENPTFFGHYVGCQSRRFIFQWKSRFSSRYVSGIPNLIKPPFFCILPSVSCAQYTRCHLLLSTSGSVSQLLCHTSAGKLIFFSPNLLSVSFSSYCSPRCPQVKSDLKPRSRVCWAYLSGKNNKSNEWLEKNNKQ